MLSLAEPEWYVHVLIWRDAYRAAALQPFVRFEIIGQLLTNSFTLLIRQPQGLRGYAGWPSAGLHESVHRHVYLARCKVHCSEKED